MTLLKPARREKFKPRRESLEDEVPEGQRKRPRRTSARDMGKTMAPSEQTPAVPHGRKRKATAKHFLKIRMEIVKKITILSSLVLNFEIQQ